MGHCIIHKWQHIHRNHQGPANTSHSSKITNARIIHDSNTYNGITKARPTLSMNMNMHSIHIRRKSNHDHSHGHGHTHAHINRHRHLRLLLSQTNKWNRYKEETVTTTKTGAKHKPIIKNERALKRNASTFLAPSI